MNFKILPTKQDPEQVHVYGDLRREMLERYEIYLEDNDSDDEIAQEIEKDIREGGSLTLNAYAAQEFISGMMEGFDKRSALYKYSKRFLVDSGIYVEENPERPIYEWSSSSDNLKRKAPDFVLDGTKYFFKSWLKRS